MIPYLSPPGPVLLFGQRMSVFGLLLFAAFVATYVALLARGRAVAASAGGGPREVEWFARVVLLAALLGAHVAGVLSEHGAAAFARPSVFLNAQSTLPSAAGAATATLAAVVYVRARRLDLKVFADLVAYAFPFGWMFARAGCGLSHDHPGRLSTSWLAVAFPGGARFDCGLLELFATPLLVALVVVLGGKARRPGVLAATLGASYGVLRFGLDFLRASDLPGSDPRYGGMTAAQWMCVPLFAGCAWLALARGGNGAVSGVVR